MDYFMNNNNKIEKKKDTFLLMYLASIYVILI